jgi:hypothetical protein
MMGIAVPGTGGTLCGYPSKITAELTLLDSYVHLSTSRCHVC